MKTFFKFTLICSLLVIHYSLLLAQDSLEVQSYIAKLNHGQVDEVRKALPELITNYQNDPGVIYIQARLASNGIEALKLYQSIVTNFPQSEWADDALFHEYQYYYSLGLYRTAEAKLQQLKHEHPRSPYASTQMGTNILSGREQISRDMKKEMPKGSERVSPKPNKRVDVGASSLIKIQKPKVEKQRDRYTLQVGAYSTSDNADKQKDFFEKRGFAAEISNKVRNGKSFYVVWVGAYRTSDEATRAKKSVKSKYKIESMVIER